MRVQVNLKLEEELVREVEELVRRGFFKSKKEAFVTALNLLIRKYKAEELRKRIDQLRKGTRNLPSAAEEVMKEHEEDDLG